MHVARCMCGVYLMQFQHLKVISLNNAVVYTVLYTVCSSRSATLNISNLM